MLSVSLDILKHLSRGNDLMIFVVKMYYSLLCIEYGREYNGYVLMSTSIHPLSLELDSCFLVNRVHFYYHI